jgi:arylsulfatase A-like enzyme
MEEYFIYINLDGFGKYYFDLLYDPFQSLPYISYLIKEGIYFENAYTGVPSITFPMQCAILSGTYSVGTHNCYLYWDGKLNQIVYQGRQNDAETLGEVLRKQEIGFISIQQFALEDRGAEKGNKKYLYIQPSGDYETRFDLLIQLIQDHRLAIGGESYSYLELPHIMCLYIDDLDAIGHNKERYKTENKRIEAVQRRLIQIDEKLGEVIEALKEKGIYDKTYILLTTDHGMVSFKGMSYVGRLIKAIKRLGFNKVIACNTLKEDENFDVLITSTGIECQIYFKELPSDLETIRQRLKQETYIEQILIKDEFKINGITEQMGDMIISPKEGKHFNVEYRYIPILMASHDSLNEKAQHIFSVLKGPNLKKGYTYEKRVKNIDFIPTIAYLLGLPSLKNATGTLLLDLLEERRFYEEGR